MNQITHKGVDVALNILVRDGFLLADPTGEPMQDTVTIIVAVEKWLDSLTKRGEEFSKDELVEMTLLAHFQICLQTELTNMQPVN
jgi:hypothetical protein